MTPEQQLLDETIALLEKTTTSGAQWVKAGRPASSWRWWNAIDKIRAVRATFDAPPATTNTAGGFSLLLRGANG